MNNLKKYTNYFFDELEVFEDLSRGHNYKVYLRQAILEFLEDETKEKAFDVYKTFFDSYRINLEGEGNPFIDLLDVLRSYEENAATLINKQRDHYIHSVNVFILGLCIYSQNTKFRTAFDLANMNKEYYPFSYDTNHEEFFYRWGIASLFHDVGYPIEIIAKQINEFMGFATEVDAGERVTSHLEFENFDELNSIVEVVSKKEFTKSYSEKHLESAKVDLLKPIDLLSHKLHLSLGVNLLEVKSALDSFVGLMAKSGFVDHGFYSAIIVLKWYGFLIQCCNYKPEYFFYPVLDSSSAILLHNYYKNVIMKPPFAKTSLSPVEHPIAYLLILCDELQEWNREAYGSIDKVLAQAEEASIIISDSEFSITYIANSGKLADGFATKKETTLRKLLNIEQVFDSSFEIHCESKLGSAPLVDRKVSIMPRPTMENLDKLAIEIHRQYNKKRKLDFKDEPLAHPEFSDLPDTLKYSNLRHARGIADKLDLMGWEMRPIDSDGVVIVEIPEDPDDPHCKLEILSEIEHDEWMKERLSSGWKYGEIKDEENKISPYLIPYDELEENIKEYDRDAVRNYPALLANINMAIYIK